MGKRLSFVIMVLCLVATTYVSLAAGAALPLIYTSPAAGALHISPTTALAVRQGSPFDGRRLSSSFFAVTGSKSGSHSGTVRLSDDQLTLLYYPDRAFAYGETVAVTVRPGMVTASGAPVAGSSFQFTTLERPAAALLTPAMDARDSGAPSPGQAGWRYQTYPEFSNVMTATVTTPAQRVDAGYVFVSGLGSFSPTEPSLQILDNAGEPVYIQKTAGGNLATDFKRQVVNGIPYLVYYQGVSHLGWANGTYYVLDQSYTQVNSWTIGNGYGADLHELQLLENGHALMLSYTTIPFDLSPFGGPVDGALVDPVIQEQDSAKNVVFEWHGSQYVPLIDSYMPLSDSPVDFMHTNAIEVDTDGNLLISNRHLSQIIKINRQTGAVIWRMGGKYGHFTLTNDSGFSFQHDIRRLPNGHLTLFDNGNQRGPQYSRAVEYAIDETAKTLTRVWQYPADQSLFSAFMGSAQRLGNGNTLIGWGGLPLVSEILPDGTKAFELSLGALSYRAFRYTWEATPTWPPSVVLSHSADPTTATIYSSWNGATGVSAYAIEAGPAANAMSLITTTARSGFETTTALAGLDPATCVFRVRPVRAQGATPYSATIYRIDSPQCRALLNKTYYLPTVTN